LQSSTYGAQAASTAAARRSPLEHAEHLAPGGARQAPVGSLLPYSIALRRHSGRGAPPSVPGPGQAARLERIEVRQTIPADPAAIFAVRRDPKGHAAIDSSGTLVAATGEPV